MLSPVLYYYYPVPPSRFTRMFFPCPYHRRFEYRGSSDDFTRRRVGKLESPARPCSLVGPFETSFLPLA